VRIAIEVEGGAVTNVLCDDSSAQLIVIDHDWDEGIKVGYHGTNGGTTELDELLEKMTTEVHKDGWCQSCEKITDHIQDPRDGWWRCSVEGCEAESSEQEPE